MKLWKRITALVLCLVLTAGLFACKKDEPADDSQAPTESTQTPDATQPDATQPPKETNIGKYNYLEKSILIRADEQNLSLLTNQQASLTVQLPVDWAAADLEVYCNNAPCGTIGKDSLTPLEETVTVTGNTYQQYTCTLNTASFTADNNYVFVKMGEKRSNSVNFFLPLKLTEKDLEDSHITLSGLSQAAEDIPVDQELSADIYLDAAMAYLKSDPNIVSTEVNGNTIFFTMKNGLTSFFMVEQFTGDLSVCLDTPTLGSTNPVATEPVKAEPPEAEPDIYTETPIVVTGEYDYRDYFEKNQNPDEYLSTINPNILVMAPIRSAERENNWFNGGADGKAEEEFGRQLEEALYYGNLDVVTDSDCNPDTIMSWDQYGVVMLNTHGPEGNPFDDNPKDDKLILNKGRDYPSTFFQMASIDSGQIFHKSTFHNFKEMMRSWNLADRVQENNSTDIYLNNNSYLGVVVRFGNAADFLPEDANIFQEAAAVSKVEGALFVTSDYLMEVLKDAEFENTVFLLDVCNGLSDPAFNDFLLSRGAACVWGYKKSINGFSSQGVIQDLGKTQLAVREETEYSQHWQLHDQPIPVKTLLEDALLECVLPDDKDSFTYYGHTTLHGTVTDRLVGTPVNEAELTLYRYYNGDLSYYDDFYTDETGRYEFTEVPFGLYMITAKFRDETVIVNFSVGSLEKKELNIRISEYIPVYSLEDLQAETGYYHDKYLLMNDIVCPDDYPSTWLDDDIFDGNGHTISNITYPVFEVIANSQVKNLYLVTAQEFDLMPSMERRADYGLLASQAYNATITNCHADGELFLDAPEKVYGSLAGLIGTLEHSTMKHCSSQVDITFRNVRATSFMGGIAAYAPDCTFIDCHNSGNLYLSTEHNERYIVTGFYLRVGGLVGNGNGTMEYCSNTGSVSSIGGQFVGTRAGGLIGEGDATIKNSWNAGNIYAYMPTESSLDEVHSLMQGTSTLGSKGEADELRKGVNNTNFLFWYTPGAGGYAGGLVGFAGGVTLHNCYNNADVDGTYFAGGLVGRTAFMELRNAINLGDVAGSFCAAGMVGFWYNSSGECLIQSSYLLGTAAATYIYGPFYGFSVNTKTTVENSATMVTADTSIGCSQAPALGVINGIEDVLSDPNYDFENVWEYSEEDGLLLRPYSPAETQPEPAQ